MNDVDHIRRTIEMEDYSSFLQGWIIWWIVNAQMNNLGEIKPTEFWGLSSTDQVAPWDRICQKQLLLINIC